MKLEDLAKELNHVLGLNPRLELTKPKRELRKEIEKASALIMESDGQPGRRDENNNTLPHFSQEAVDALKEMDLWP